MFSGYTGYTSPAVGITRTRKEVAEMDEIMMRLYAKMFNLKVICFCVDYKQDGHDRHMPMLALHTGNDMSVAAHGVFDQMVAQGMLPQVIWYVPGDHTIEELDAMMEEPQDMQQVIPVFVSDNAIKEAQAMQTIRGVKYAES